MVVVMVDQRGKMWDAMIKFVDFKQIEDSRKLKSKKMGKKYFANPTCSRPALELWSTSGRINHSWRSAFRSTPVTRSPDKRLRQRREKKKKKGCGNRRKSI